MTINHSISGEPQRVERGARLAIDVGMARVGVASSDPDGILATPVATLARDKSVGYAIGGKVPAVMPKDVAELVDLIEDRFVKVVYIGLPQQLSGAKGQSVEMALTYAHLLQVASPAVQIWMIDERMTTVTAHQTLRAAGKKTKSHRSVVDQVAAVVMLESALDYEKKQGVRAGKTLAEVLSGRS